MKSYLRKNWIQITLAFFLPILLVFLAFFANGIYWDGPSTVLAGDAYHQYVAIYSMYSRLLHTGTGFFYSWTSGLGLNLYAFASYYMGSFFMPLTYFFNVKNMPDALYLFTLIKFGAISLSAFISFSHIYRKVNTWLVLVLSICFSLMSFLTSQIEIIMWLDVFILLPLILWGLHGLLGLDIKNRRLLYFISLSILFIQNYYFGFMIAIFALLYFIARSLAIKNSWKEKIQRFIDFAITSLLAGLTSLIMLLPMYLDLRANGQAFSTVSQLWTENSWPLDLFAKNFVGSYDTTQFNAIPMIYVGLLPLILALLFFINREISWRLKAALAALFLFFIASFYFNWLDLAWQGFHTPNMFLHRYSFLFSLLIIIMAFECLSNWQGVKISQLIIVTAFLILGFGATIITRHYNDYLSIQQIFLTALFMGAYFLLLFGLLKHYLPLKLFLLLALLFGAVDMGVNGYYQIKGIKEEWVFPARDYYNQKANSQTKIVSSIQSDAKAQLVRTDDTNPDTANDGMKFGYNAISQFSSVRNSNSSHVMSLLGFHTDGDYLNLRYPANTLLMDAAFGINYNINDFQPSKFGFSTIPNTPGQLIKNNEALSLGIFVPGHYQDVKLSETNILGNQTVFINALSGQQKSYFEAIPAVRTANVGRISTEPSSYNMARPLNSKETLSVTYKLQIPADCQAYLNLSNIDFENDQAKNIDILLPTTHYSLATNSAGQYFNLGYYPMATSIDVTISFPDNGSVSFNFPQFLALNLDAYQSAIEKMRANPVTTSPLKNGAVMTYEATKAGQLFLTVPYDKGWSAKLDGKPVELEKAQEGFMKVSAPAGKHHLELHFFPQGLKIGILCFVLGVVLFIFYNFRMNTQDKKRKLKNKKS